MDFTPKILIVDDKELNRRLLQKHLENAGFTKMVQASNGEEALEIARQELPDLILLDIMMPGMDGYEVCSHLKSDEYLKSTPVIFLSALDETEDKVKAFDQGGVDYIVKPFAFKEVQARVRNHLQIYYLQKDLEKTNYRLEQIVHELEVKNKVIDDLYQKLDEQVLKTKQIYEETFLDSLTSINLPENIHLDAHYCPAQRVGGDFYGVVRASDKLVIYLSDVTGHSLEGIIISTFVKETVENYVALKPDDISPEKIMAHINKQYRKDNYPHDYFVCIFMAVLDLNTYQLQYTSAGMQFPPLVKIAPDERIELPVEGPPISSVIPEEVMNFNCGQLTLQRGISILFYTDGIAEEGDDLRGTYEERLRNTFFNQPSSLSPKQIKDAINQDFYNFNGSWEGVDDITYLVLQYK